MKTTSQLPPPPSQKVENKNQRKMEGEADCISLSNKTSPTNFPLHQPEVSNQYQLFFFPLIFYSQVVERCSSLVEYSPRLTYLSLLNAYSSDHSLNINSRLFCSFFIFFSFHHIFYFKQELQSLISVKTGVKKHTLVPRFHFSRLFQIIQFFLNPENTG